MSGGGARSAAGHFGRAARVLRRASLLALLAMALVSLGALASAPTASAQTIADSDGDRIDDSNDNCPHLPAPDSTFFGCPSEDPDGDGFRSTRMGVLVGDFCGEIAGNQEFLGCPSNDPDGDGLVEDSCTQVAAPPPTGCLILAPPEVASVKAGRLSLDRRRGLSLYGSPFRPKPSGLFTPQTLTVWLPKGLSQLAGRVRTCSEEQARSLEHGTLRCTRIAAGRLSGDDDKRAWQAYAGPKRGSKRLVWLRAKTDDGSLTGFAEG